MVSWSRADVNAYVAEAHGLVWGLTQAVEAAIYLAAEIFRRRSL